MPSDSLAVRPSKKQKELLSFIDTFITGHGYGPSYREIMRALNYKSVSTVAIHIDALIVKGHLRKRDRSARSLEVVDQPKTGTATIKTSPAQEKWIVGMVSEKFSAYESAPSAKLKDDLYVLVGALHVLGLEGPASMFKARLKDLN